MKNDEIDKGRFKVLI